MLAEPRKPVDRKVPVSLREAVGCWHPERQWKSKAVVLNLSATEFTRAPTVGRGLIKYSSQRPSRDSWPGQRH